MAAVFYTYWCLVFNGSSWRVLSLCKYRASVEKLPGEVIYLRASLEHVCVGCVEILGGVINEVWKGNAYKQISLVG